MKWSFNKVNDALDNIGHYTSYYLGRTLCIDFKYGPSVLLNLNGRGQFYMFPDKGEFMEGYPTVDFLMTKEMQTKVNALYLAFKD